MSDMRSYDGIVRSWGYEIIASARFGDYQGDECFFLKDGDLYGWLVCGYGSCSGCDALEAAWGYEYDDDADAPKDVLELAVEMKRSVRWAPKEGMVEMLRATADNDRIEWYSSDGTVDEFMLAMVTVLTGEVPT